MILDFIRFTGGQSERISNTGRPLDLRHNVVDVTGHMRTIGSMTWIPGTGTRGTADISATIQGRSVKIEVKCKATNDRQSEPQKRYQEEVERSGGLYVIATSFEQFYTWYNELFTPEKQAQ
jgi:preprotein translocase subunit SecA